MTAPVLVCPPAERRKISHELAFVENCDQLNKKSLKMKIICKELKGDEVVLDVSETTKIADVKKEIESKLGVPG